MVSLTVSANTSLVQQRGGDVAIAGARTVRPANLAAVIGEVLAARDAGETIAVVGAGFPAATKKAHLALDISALTGVVDTNAAANTVTFYGGATVRDARELLRKQGLDLVGSPADGRLTLAGAASTGAHGLNPAEPIFSGAIAGIGLVTIDGQLRNIDERRDAQFWSAAKLSLGALGVPVTVTVKVRPYVGLELRQRKRNINELVYELAEARNKTDFYCVDWRPLGAEAHLTVGWYSDESTQPAVAVEKRAELTAAEPKRKTGRFRRFREAVARRLPFLAPVLTRAANRFDRFGEQTELPAVLDDATTEFYIAPSRMPFVVETLQEFARGHRGLGSARVRISLVAPDDAWASAAYRREMVAVAVTVPAADRAALAEVEDLLLWLGGLPNWGRFNTVTGAEAAHVMPRFSDFLHICHDLDPYGQMQNRVAARLIA